MLNSVVKKDDYENLLKDIRNRMDGAEFPMMLECMKPEKVTLEEIRETIVRLNLDTGMDISFRIGLNGDCGMVHCVLIIEELAEDQERDPRLVQ